MKTDKHKTDVKFLVNENDLFAFFPNENYDNGNLLKSAYSHIGQHSACCEDYAEASRPATQSERKDLITELQSIGYNLNILN